MKEERRAPFETRMINKQVFEVCAAMELRRKAKSLLHDGGELSPESIGKACGLTAGMARKVIFDVERYKSRPYYKEIKDFDVRRKLLITDLDLLGFKVIDYKLDIGRESAHRLAKKYMGDYKNLAQHKQKDFESSIKKLFKLSSSEI